MVQNINLTFHSKCCSLSAYVFTKFEFDTLSGFKVMTNLYIKPQLPRNC